MSVVLHPDIEKLDKSSLCYSIYSQLYLNFFNAQDRRDADHPLGVIEGDDTSKRLKNTAFGFAASIAGSVAGEGGGMDSGGILIDYLKKSGGDLTGLLRANSGFEAGTGNTRILETYLKNETDESGAITSQNFGLRITGDLLIGERNFYIGNRQFLRYDNIRKTGYLDAPNIDFGKAKLFSFGELCIGSGESNVILLPGVIRLNGFDVYHSGNANQGTINWCMRDSTVKGHLSVSGKVILAGNLDALYGVHLGFKGVTIASLSEEELALNGFLSFGADYGIKLGGLPVFIRRASGEIQLGGTDGDLLLGSERTTKIRLFSGISDINGDYLVVSVYGDGYFPGSLLVRHNRGENLLSSYRENEDDEGMIVFKFLRFGSVDGAYLSGDLNGLNFAGTVVQIKDGKQSLHVCLSRMEYRLAGSVNLPLSRDCYSLSMNTDADIITCNVPVEVWGHLGIDGSTTKLTDKTLYLNHELRLEATTGGIKHFGNSIFKGNLSSEYFSSGFSGRGWAIMSNAVTGNITATFDDVVVRRKFLAYEFEVSKASVTNGTLWVSDACSGDSVEQIS